LFVLALIGAVLLGCTGNAFAAELHAFDPFLSLTGNCKVEAVDPVEDPGLCPIPPGTVFNGEPGADHPSARFNSPAGIATDSYGDVYVASAGDELTLGDEGRIDIFDSAGNFITEFADPNGPGSMAVDSKGNLYVSNHFSDSEENVVRYSPSVFKPQEGVIEYKPTPKVLVPEGFSGIMGLALDPSTDHLLVKFTEGIAEYKSAAEENALIEKWGEFSADAGAIAVDAARNRIYIDHRAGGVPVIEAFELASPHTLLFKIEGSAVPKEEFLSNLLSLAVDEGSGHLFLYDGAERKVYEFDASGSYVTTIEHSFSPIGGAEIAVDNGKNSPNGALNPSERFLYVPSGTNLGHSYAFGPPTEGEPIIESTSVANVGEAEAELEALIEPFGLHTEYVFEYLSARQYEEQGGSFEGAKVAGEGTIPAANSPQAVAAAIGELEPETRYRFRVFVENTLGTDEAENEFATFPAVEPFEACANDPLRTGFSALLPDCRAYELVTPPDTNARSPRGVNNFLASGLFATREASPRGDQVSFEIEGGSLPGAEAIGSLAGDPYLASRVENGWNTSYVGPNGSEAPSLQPGSHSPDQQHSFWSSNGGEGSSEIGGEGTNYVRYPDGHSALVGRGSLADDPRAQGKLISEGGTHILFISGGAGPALQLEPDAPPSGTAALYDRTPDEATHVVSLLPGNETPEAGQDAFYQGASLDGRGVAFSIGGTLYLRYADEETYELGTGATFAGVAEGGSRAFYLKGGDLFRFDAQSKETTPFSTSGDVTPVNVSADGSSAYFVSPSILGEENPNGELAEEGKENLYRSEEGEISFVGTVTERDVAGRFNGVQYVEGLGLWSKIVGAGELAVDPSRITPDGDGLLFESRANLDDYDSEGHAEVYRYDASANVLDCLSCNPTLAPASSNASLQSVSNQLGALEPLGPVSAVENLSPQGNRAFFQSSEALVPGDVDGLQDVYEWEAQGVGSCNRESGCIYLVSSGQSLRIDYLYATSDAGDDVFFRTSDILLPRDAEETASIYDARVGGGFSEECSPGQCEPLLPQPSSTAAPGLSSPATQETGPSGNAPNRTCPKGKHRVKRGGKVRCVKKHHKHHHRKAGSKKKGGRGK
jgi:hypothetical protein